MPGKRRPLILAFHAVSSSWRTGLAVSERVLERQVSFLQRRGYVGLTFIESERRRVTGTLPEKSVVVTFDDGLASVVRAKPILDAVGFPGTIFVIKNFMENGDPPYSGWLESVRRSEHASELQPLDWATAEMLVEGGWEVGSHTVSHPLLPNLPDDELTVELDSSRAWIVERLGRCETLAYPYGRADERVASVAEKAGYVAACTLTGAHLVDEPYRRPRLELYEADVGLRLAAKTSPLSIALRRSNVAKARHHLRRRRDWLPAKDD
jgi:peptidoglycan/xylan/chitin deacetylase (PgdA/CDA1 family)